LVEEVEDALKGFVGDMEVGVVPLDAVFLENAAIEVGNVADEFYEFLIALSRTWSRRLRR